MSLVCVLFAASMAYLKGMSEGQSEGQFQEQCMGEFQAQFKCCFSGAGIRETVSGQLKGQCHEYC